MQVVRWPGEQAPSVDGAVVTLGVFDGVHRGHREVIMRVLRMARLRSASSAIVTFDRHPALILSTEQVPAITSLEHRLCLFEGLGLDVCVVLSFTPDLAALSAFDFARTVFRDLLHAEAVVLGFNSRFGHGGKGDASTCREAGRDLGFQVFTAPPVEVAGTPISSTGIRQAILAGQFDRAAALLGRPFSLYGTVVHGDGRGRELGFPTANLDLHNETVPPYGVYACRVLMSGRCMPAVTSIGTRATFHSETGAERVVEVHVIGWRGPLLYGQDIEVQFATALRGQRVFGSAADLKRQMAHDVDDALRMLADEDPTG